MADENNNEDYDSTKDDINEAAENGKEEAKSTASEFKEGWNQATNGGDNKKMLAGLLALFLGAFGVHKFILGYNKEGIILLSITLVSFILMCVFIGFLTVYIGVIIGIIEGIIYLTKSDEEFYNTYQANKKPWF